MNNKVLWLTGLSGAGKTTLALALQQELQDKRYSCSIIDGDIFRQQYGQDLGFSEQDRDTNIQRMAQVAKQQLEDFQYVIVAAISPLTASREKAKIIIGADSFFEIFIDTPLSVCEKRDVKGLYKKARAGEIKQFTGIDSPYQSPKKPDVICPYENSLKENIITIERLLKQTTSASQ